MLHGFDVPAMYPETVVRGSDGALYGLTLGQDDLNAVLFRVELDGTGYREVFEFEPQARPTSLVKGPLTRLFGTLADSVPEAVFAIDEDGSGFEVLHAFDSGSGTPLSLLLGSDGRLYGISGSGWQNDRYGSIFRLDQDGSGFETLHAFACLENGAYPSALIEGIDGILYGTTAEGGSDYQGTLFAVDKDGRRFRTLHQFGGPEGWRPIGLAPGPDGAVYGTTYKGSAGDGLGTIFRFLPGRRAGESHVEVLHEFAWETGASPKALLVGADGDLYGAAALGGAWGVGTLFTLGRDGSGFAVLRELSGADGLSPSSLLEAQPGTLAATTMWGGAVDPGGPVGEGGVVLRIGTDGSDFLLLHVFDWGIGALPRVGLLEGTDGALYGTTGGTRTREGAGTVFAIRPDGSDLRKLHGFSVTDGDKPETVLIHAGGALRGMTRWGGAWDNGTLFAIEEDGSGFSSLHDFDDAGYEPSRTFVRGSDGALYGTMAFGGDFWEGIVFKVQEDGSGFQTLHHFDGADGSWPQAGLVVGADGRLYGVASAGGSFYAGTLFAIEEDGSGFLKLHDFEPEEGAAPSSLLPAGDGTLYGTTDQGGISDDGWGYGTVFRIAEDGSGFLKLHDFDGPNGANPNAILLGADGRLYGTTRSGGEVVMTLANPTSGATSTSAPDPGSRLDPVCAPAQTQQDLVRFPLEGVIDFNECLGEPVVYDGFQQLVIQSASNRGGELGFPQHFVSNSILKLQGEGLISAAGYQFNSPDEFQVQTESPFGSYPLILTWVARVTLTRQADGRAWAVEASMKLVLDSDGTAKVDRSEWTMHCAETTAATSVQESLGDEPETAGSPAAATTALSSSGTAFRLNTDGTGFEKLHDFDDASGAWPNGLIQAGDGAFYGTTQSGGPGDGGVVFRLDPP